jgi:hypothetical protein
MCCGAGARRLGREETLAGGKAAAARLRLESDTESRRMAVKEALGTQHAFRGSGSRAARRSTRTRQGWSGGRASRAAARKNRVSAEAGREGATRSRSEYRRWARSHAGSAPRILHVDRRTSVETHALRCHAGSSRRGRIPHASRQACRIKVSKCARGESGARQAPRRLFSEQFPGLQASIPYSSTGRMLLSMIRSFTSTLMWGLARTRRQA